MKKIFFLFLIIYNFSMSLFSQDNYSRGFIVTLSQDTIYGKIKHAVNGEMHFRIQFIDSLENKSTLTTKYIKSYKIGNDYYYTKMYPHSYDYYYFFKLIIDGEIRLYEFTRPPESIKSGIIRSVHMNTNGGIAVSFPNLRNQYTITLIEKNNLFKVVDGSRFKSLIKKFVKDDPEIMEKVKDKTYEQSEIYILVKNYNENYKKRNP